MIVPRHLDAEDRGQSGDQAEASGEVEQALPRTASGKIPGFLIIVGPGEGGIAADAIHTILCSYTNSKIWLRDDCTQDGTFEKLQSLADAHPQRIDLARNPVPLGYKGIAVSAFRSFERICQSGEPLEMVIQLDPDVLLAGDEIVSFARTKFAAEGPGIIGSYMLSATKARRSHTAHRNRILLDLFPAGFDRYHKLLRFGTPFYAKYLVRAFRNGYRLGRHVLGAFYIVHGDTLQALDAAGFWKSMPDLGSREVKLDDPLISMGPYIVGHKLIDLHEHGDSRFWIQYQNPISLSAEQILGRGYLALHPVKNDISGLALRAQLAQMDAHFSCP
jgi:hypothetical protein